MSQTPEPENAPDPAFPRLDRAHGLLVLALAGLAACFPIDDPDFYWHLKTGQTISRDRALPVTDPFSLLTVRSIGPDGRAVTEPPFEWVNMSWLWDVAFYQVYRLLGPVGLSIVKMAAAMLLAGLLVASRPAGASLWWASLIAAVALGPISFRLQARPEVASFLWLALVLLILERFHDRRGTRWIAALPLVLLVWANTHALFMLGLATIGLCVVGHGLHVLVRGRGAGGVSRRWVLGLAGVLVVCVGACCITPYGGRGLVFPFEQLLPKITLPLYGERVSEFRSDWRHMLQTGDLAVLGTTDWALAALVAAAAASFVVNGRRLSLPRLLVFAAFVFLGYTAQRNGALCAMVAALVLVANTAEWWAGRRRRGRLGRGMRVATLVGLIAAGLLAAAGPLPIGILGRMPLGVGLRPVSYCTEAARFVRQADIPGHAFTTQWGQAAVLIWENGPERPVFFDGRLEVYDAARFQLEERVRLALAADRRDGPAGWRLVFDAYGITHLLVDLTRVEQLHTIFESTARSRHWALVHLDAVCAVFVRRTPAMAGVIAEHGLDLERLTVRPAEAPPVPALPPPPELTLWRLVAGLRRESPSAPVDLSYQYIRLGRPLLAIRLLRRTLAEAPGSALASYYLALAHLTLAEREAKASAGPGPEGRRSVAPFALRRTLDCDPFGRSVGLQAHRLAMWRFADAGLDDLALEHAERVLSLTAGADPPSTQTPPPADDGEPAPSPVPRHVLVRRRLRAEARKVADERRERVRRKIDEAARPAGAALAAARRLAAEPVRCVGAAIDVLERAAGRRGPEADSTLVDLYVAAGRIDDAADLLAIGSEASGEQIGDWATRCPASALAVLWAYGRYEEARRLLAARIERLAGDAGARAVCYEQMGCLQLEAGRAAEAQSAFEQAVKCDAGNARAKLYLGRMRQVRRRAE